MSASNYPLEQHLFTHHGYSIAATYQSPGRRLSPITNWTRTSFDRGPTGLRLSPNQPSLANPEHNWLFFWSYSTLSRAMSEEQIKANSRCLIAYMYFINKFQRTRCIFTGSLQLTKFYWRLLVSDACTPWPRGPLWWMRRAWLSILCTPVRGEPSSGCPEKGIEGWYG